MALCVAAMLIAPRAAAEALSDFEREIKASALNERGLVEDPTPEGKLIEDITVVVVDPFDERDPVPEFVNALHVRSQNYVVLQELALQKGAYYSTRRADDSMQRLRVTNKFSLVLLIAVRGSNARAVRLLVVVKDIWSLRLQWDTEVVGGRRTLLLNPSEVNLLGSHATLGTLFYLEPDRMTLGATFFEPQVGPSNIGLYATGGSILQRSSGDSEGNYGYFAYYRPFKSSFERWAWSVGMGWRNEVTRRYVGAQIRTVRVANAAGEVEELPEVFETDRLAGEYELTRSFGVKNKTDVSLGVEVDRRRYRLPEEFAAFSPEARAAFLGEVVPTSDTRISPFSQVRARSTRFHRLTNVETLSLQEDLWLGHDALLRVYPAGQSLGSSRSLLGVEWALGYSLALGAGITRALLRANIQLADDNRNDVEFEAGFRFVSPGTAIGRLHLAALALDRYRNYLNLPAYSLGGQNRLRGYDYGAFRGDKLVAVNAEYRSLPIEVLGVHLAGVAFYDAGDAGQEFQALSLKHSVGAGARLLFPQFDRTVFRIDWGLPLNSEHRGFVGGFSVAFGQAFSMPLIEEPSVLSGVLPE